MLAGTVYSIGGFNRACSFRPVVLNAFSIPDIHEHHGRDHGPTRPRQEALHAADV